MMNIKYKKNETVFVYEHGLLVPKTISKSRITVDGERQIIEYLFKNKSFHEFWIDQHECFSSGEDFLDVMKKRIENRKLKQSDPLATI